jgi:hypothetical protein
MSTAYNADRGTGKTTSDGLDRDEVVARQEDKFGGIKVGAAFFGWLCAIGTAVLLLALASAAGAVLGVVTDTSVADVADEAERSVETIGIVGGIVLAVVIFVAYYCGGYVAGRMARFNGAKQGVAVWVWMVVVAVVLAIAGAVAGAEYNVLASFDGFPRIPVDEGDLTTGGIIALVVAFVVALLAAILGGTTGVRYHRKVDDAGFDH